MCGGRAGVEQGGPHGGADVTGCTGAPGVKGEPTS